MVDREKVIKGLKQCAIDGEESCKECPYFGVTCCLDVLQEEASIILLKEQEAIVRCKDCKIGTRTEINGKCVYVTCGGEDHEPDWFCADGERRQDDV